MKTVKTFWATIFVGTKNIKEDIIYHLGVAEYICQEYCNEVGLCVSFTPTTYIYTKNPQRLNSGQEPGIIIQLINYPRFSDSLENIEKKAVKLAKLLKKQLRQYKITIMMPEKTIMLEEGDENED